MIKRIFYRQEHGERDDASGSDSSSSSDSDLDTQTSEEAVEPEEHDEEDDHRHELQCLRSHAPSTSSSSSSGYESENSSADELDPVDSSGTDCAKAEIDGQKLVNSLLSRKGDNKIARGANIESLPDDLAKCVVKYKSVFKCKLCPKIVCLNPESLKSHLNSKRHSRSEKLQKNGRLKRMLNSDGEEIVLEEVGETHAERHARIVALTKDKPKKKNKGRQRQRERYKRKMEQKSCSAEEAGQGTDGDPNKKPKNI